MRYDMRPYERNGLVWINPYDKYQRGVGFNPSENSEFSHICLCGSNQILECYCGLDHKVSNLDIAYLCGECPYAYNGRFSIHSLARETKLQHPYFINDIVETVDTDEKKAGYFVYFISDGQFVKIGISNDVKKRLGDLQVGNPKPLTVLFSVPVRNKKDALELEYRLHNVYSEFAGCGEWFDILNYIKVEEFQKYFS